MIFPSVAITPTLPLPLAQGVVSSFSPCRSLWKCLPPRESTSLLTFSTQHHVSFVELFTVVIMLSVIVVVASFFNVNSTHKGGELCLVHHCNLRGKECLVLKKSVG